MFFIWTRKGGRLAWERLEFAFSKVETAERVAAWIRTDQPSLDVAYLPNGVTPTNDIS